MTDDVRHALRLYLGAPAASSIALLVLAIGIAFVTSFVSLYVDLVLKPHPGFESSGRLATVGLSVDGGVLGFPYELVTRLSDENVTIDAAAAWTNATTLVGSGREETGSILVSAQFFSGLRPRIALGRGLESEDHLHDAEPVVVLSYRYWEQRFGGEPNILGTTIEIARDPGSPYRSVDPFSPVEPDRASAEFRVVGVTARSVRGLPVSRGEDYEPSLWIPLEPAWPLLQGAPETLPGAGLSATYIRRASGATSIAVASELRARYGETDAMASRPRGGEIDAMDGIVSSMAAKRDAERQLRMFLAGSLVLALVAGANLSLFLLARAPGRRRELAIRIAVGARVRRLARQLATEAGLLVVIAAALGLLMSIWLSVFFQGLAFLRDANFTEVTLLDWRVLTATGAFQLALVTLIAPTPIIGIKTLGIGASSRRIASRASPGQRLAGNVQIAGAVTLSAVAIAVSWHLGELMLRDPGYKFVDRYVVTFPRITTFESSIEDRALRARVEQARVSDAIEAIPGVSRVAFGNPVPGYASFGRTGQVPDPADPNRTIDVYVGSLDTDFVGVLALRLIHGRAPEPYEDNVVLVNRTLAHSVWGRENVVGERIPAHNAWGRDGAEVIGMLDDLSYGHPSMNVIPYVFTAAGFARRIGIVETQLTATELHQAFERASNDGVIDLSGGEIQALDALRSELIAPDRARGLLTLGTAILVVALATLGYFGMQRYLVASGRREYAIRASLGASPSALGRLVIRRGLGMSLPGILLGASLAFATVSWLRTDYFSREVSPMIVAMLATIVMTAILVAASIGPSREARRTLPAQLLREE